MYSETSGIGACGILGKFLTPRLWKFPDSGFQCGIVSKSPFVILLFRIASHIIEY